jgi:hypothetical protein
MIGAPVVRTVVHGIVDGIVAIAVAHYHGWREVDSVRIIAVVCLAIVATECWLWLWRDALKFEPPRGPGVAHFYSGRVDQFFSVANTVRQTSTGQAL